MHRDSRDHLKQCDGNAQLATSPAELVDDGLECQANGKARAAADEQHHEAGSENKKGDPGG